MPTTQVADGDPVKKRVVVLVQKPGLDDDPDKPPYSGRAPGVVGAAILVLILGLAFGHRAAEIINLLNPVRPADAILTERVKGGLYALEVNRPEGETKWLLEFDAEIVTRDGPQNPLELRDALEKLVIEATSMPMVQTATNPDNAMRRAMLAIAAQDYPWLVDIYMSRSDMRSADQRLMGIGNAMRR